MTKAEYIILFDKYLNGQASHEEIDLIFAYEDQFDMPHVEEESLDEHHKKIEARLIRNFNRNIRFKRALKFVYKMSAAAVLFLSITILIFNHNRNILGKQDGAQIAKTIILPGSNKAVLRLASGKTIVLNDIGDGNITKEDNVTLKKERKGLVKFNINNSATTANDVMVPEMLSVTTPKGGQYQLVLPDGTRVWLNAASDLKFPTKFTGNERKVVLNGEAYFEVTKNKQMPFKVEFNKEQVTVLGTHFNIRAYHDDPESQTTLLEGSVKIANSKFSKVIVPGEQAVCSGAEQNMMVSTARVDDVMGWKNGYFSFHKSDIRSIMRQAARWYDIDVVYRANLTDKIYGGRVSRFENISELLKNLELTGTIHFKVEGRSVTVME